MTGELSLHGVTKPVTLEVTLNKIGINPRNHLPSVGFEATTTLKRSDFGLGNYVPQVSDEIQIHITCQGEDSAAKKAAEQAAKSKT